MKDFFDKELSHSDLEAISKSLQLETLEGKKQDRGERKKYALLTYCLVVFYIVSVLTITILNGCNVIELSDPILIALIVTSFAKIVGLFVFVMKYLFDNNKE
ncbi:MAG: hypothetical protein MI866_05215 [Bacteroidales bacterium]|nr:hypothetical protein [Bacteroidales bacterium]